MDGNNMNNDVNETVENATVQTTSSYDAYSYEAPAAETASVSGGGNGMAIASLICGIASIVCCVFGCLPIGAGVAAIILGINGQKKCENANMAKIGMILGIVGIVVTIIVLIIAFASGVAVGILEEL